MSQISLTRLSNIGLLLLIAFLWASAFGAMKVAVSETGPITLAALRSSIAAIVLLGVLRLQGPLDWRIGWHYLPQFFVIGGLGTALPFMLIPWAELRIDSSLAGLLMSVGPLATLAGAWAFGLETDIPKSRIIGILIGLCGALLMFADGFSAMGHANLIAQFATVAAALCYACGNLMVRQLSSVPPLTISAFAMTLCALISWPLALFFEESDPQSYSQLAWQMILWLGLMPTAFAFSIRYILIKRAGASFTSYVGYLIPGIALIIGAVGLGEAISLEKIIALLLIMIGLLSSQKPSPAKTASNK
ncbi:MAG: DMT family transporter [Candidatus Puniceispirillaceae bacterium]